jgi:DNA (cytosine-5)-methyltransferase 1
VSTYINLINKTLKPTITETAMVLDLFAGCGGLSLGFEAAGFETIGFEMDKAAVHTYIHNLSGQCYNIKLEKGYSYPQADIIVGGPPCQPFSVGGYQRGIEDVRDGFPVFIDAVRQLQPSIFMFENVRGLLYANKSYLSLITDELQKEGYIIEYKLINAVEYGVPQNRERLFVIGHRSKFRFPAPMSKHTTVGEAIGDTMFDEIAESKFLTPSMDAYVAKYEKASACVNPRDLNFNKPARTLTCRNLAGATGDMQRVKIQDGRRRRISQREAARLQSFPDWFTFSGNETQQYNQIGNAVPPLLAYHLACAIKHCYHQIDQISPSDILASNLRPNKTLSLF